MFLKDYREEHPEVTVLDPPNAIQHLHNRQSMLQEVADLNLSNGYGEVCTPRQLVIMKDPSSIPDAVAKAGLTLPLVAKPLVVDGTSKSHELSLAYVEASLPSLDPPLVLQEFVNHGKYSIILLYTLANYWSILKLILLSVQVGSYLRYILLVKLYGLSVGFHFLMLTHMTWETMMASFGFQEFPVLQIMQKMQMLTLVLQNFLQHHF
jgi:hypothetical protein